MTEAAKPDARATRLRQGGGRVVAFSVSYEPDNLLARGLGLEHLQDLLTRIAGPLLRSGMNLAYGGNWKPSEDNFTYHLLDLINAQLNDRDFNAATDVAIGMLYNHSAWPHYLEVTPAIEAQWVRCCRIVRVTQQMAGITDVFPDARAGQRTPRKNLNMAVVASRMRRLAMEGMTIVHPSGVEEETIPAVSARVTLGGRLDGYSGFMPGIFEEAEETLRANKPLYILGGFGGASEALAKAIVEPDAARDAVLTLAGQPKAAALLDMAGAAVVQDIKDRYAKLAEFVADAREAPERRLNTGLDRDESRELLLTSSISRAAELTRKGLKQAWGLSLLTP